MENGPGNVPPGGIPEPASGKRRPGTVIIFTVIVALVVVYNLYVAAKLILTSVIIAAFLTALSILALFSLLVALINIIATVPAAIMMHNFWGLRRKALKWVYITFGLGIAATAIKLLDSFSMENLISLGVMLFFMWAISDYIRKKKLDGNYLFS